MSDFDGLDMLGHMLSYSYEASKEWIFTGIFVWQMRSESIGLNLVKLLDIDFKSLIQVEELYHK